jgi:hypothetical protein
MNKIRMTGALALALWFPALCLAQSAPATPARSQVVLVHIKPDMMNEWIDLQKNEVIPALKKAGVKTRTTYRTVFGNNYEFILITPLDKFAQLDGQGPFARALGAEGAARLTAKLSKCTESRQVFIANAQPELSNGPAGELPTMGVFTRRRVASGKMQEYENFIKSEVLPIYKKADARYTVSRRGLGANSNDMVSITWIDKAADLDAGSLVVRTLGPEGTAKLVAKGAGFATLMETVVRRRAPELSF